MAIFKPGQRHRNHNILKRRGHKRSTTAVLSLTAMVDMFTVLAIFLLQNYNATGEVLHIPMGVALPKANSVLELKPSLVVTVSSNEITINETLVATFEEVKNSKSWLIKNLRDRAIVLLEKAKNEQDVKLQSKIEKVVNKAAGNETEEANSWRKVTIQADKSIDYLTLKKIMYSIYEAGGGPINFAVAEDTSKDDATTKAKNK